MWPRFDPSKPFRIVSARAANGSVWCSIEPLDGRQGSAPLEVELLPPKYGSNRASLLTAIGGAEIPAIEVHKPEGGGIAVGIVPLADDPRFAMLWALHSAEASDAAGSIADAEVAVPVPLESDAKEFWGAFDFAARWPWSADYWRELCEMGYGPGEEMYLLPGRMGRWVAAMERAYGNPAPSL